MASVSFPALPTGIAPSRLLLNDHSFPHRPNELTNKPTMQASAVELSAQMIFFVQTGFVFVPCVPRPRLARARCMRETENPFGHGFRASGPIPLWHLRVPG